MSSPADPVTAPTPERRVGEASSPGVTWVAPSVAELVAENARLTAEVERLTKAVKLHADGLERADLGYFAQSLRAALNPLPTPAPEGTDGK